MSVQISQSRCCMKHAHEKTIFSRHNRTDTRELTDTVTTCLRPATGSRQTNPSTTWEVGTKYPATKQSIAAGRGKTSFLSWSATGCLRPTPGQAPGLGVFGQHKTNSRYFSGIFILFFLKRKNMMWDEWWCRSGRSQGMGRHMIKIYCLKLSTDCMHVMIFYPTPV